MAYPMPAAPRRRIQPTAVYNANPLLRSGYQEAGPTLPEGWPKPKPQQVNPSFASDASGGSASDQRAAGNLARWQNGQTPMGTGIWATPAGQQRLTNFQQVSAAAAADDLRRRNQAQYGGGGNGGGGPGGGPIDASGVVNANLDQSRGLIADVNAGADLRQSQLRGFLGKNNMLESGFGANTLSQAEIDALRAKGDIGNQFATTEAGAKLDASKFNANYGLQNQQLQNQYNLGLGDLALRRDLGGGDLALRRDLGMGGLGVQQGQLALQGELGRGELSLNRDVQMGGLGVQQGQLALQGELGRGNLGVAQQQANLAGELGRGELAIKGGELGLQGQQVANQNQQFYAGQGFVADQAQLDRMFKSGYLGQQQDFEAAQAQLARQQETATTEQRGQIASDLTKLQQAYQSGESERDRQLKRETLDLSLATEIKKLGMELGDRAANRDQSLYEFNVDAGQRLQQLGAQIENNRVQNLVSVGDLSLRQQLGTGQLDLQQQQFDANRADVQLQRQLPILQALKNGQVDFSNPYDLEMLKLAGINLSPQQVRMEMGRQSMRNTQANAYQQFNVAQGMLDQWKQGASAGGQQTSSGGARQTGGVGALPIQERRSVNTVTDYLQNGGRAPTQAAVGIAQRYGLLTPQDLEYLSASVQYAPSGGMSAEERGARTAWAKQYQMGRERNPSDYSFSSSVN